MSELEQPSDTALAAAYQVTARWFASEQQLIWRRTALFVTLNSLRRGCPVLTSSPSSGARACATRRGGLLSMLVLLAQSSVDVSRVPRTNDA